MSMEVLFIGILLLGFSSLLYKLIEIPYINRTMLYQQILIITNIETTSFTNEIIHKYFEGTAFKKLREKQQASKPKSTKVFHNISINSLEYLRAAKYKLVVSININDTDTQELSCQLDDKNRIIDFHMDVPQKGDLQNVA